MRRVVALLCLAFAACEDGGDDDGVDPGPAKLVLEPVLAVPYVAASMGASTGEFTFQNPNAVSSDLTWSLDGDPTLTIASAPDHVLGGARGTFSLRWTGATAPRVASATLTVFSQAGGQQAEIGRASCRERV